METVNIKGGSEKQNAWANKIAQEWLSEMNSEIENVELRQDVETVKWFLDNLYVAKQKLLGGFEKIDAKALIDMYVAKRTPVKALIEQARKEKKGFIMVKPRRTGFSYKNAALVVHEYNFFRNDKTSFMVCLHQYLKTPLPNK